MSENQLYRSREDRMIAGVCGGLGEHFHIDPTLVRLAVVFLSLWWGGGILLYLLAWFIIPEKSPNETTNFLPREESPEAKEANDILDD